MVGMYAGYRSLEERGLGRCLDALTRSGVNTLILGGGYRLSPEVEALNPFKAGPSKEPDALPTVLSECRARGMKLWLVVGVAYAESVQRPEDFPDLAVVDVEGRLVAPDRSLGFGWAGSCCPSKPAINRYYEAMFEDLGGRYEFDGVTLTHHRFSPPSHNLMSLFSCFCPSCAEAARELGYDIDAMREANLSLLAALRNLKPTNVKLLSETGFTAFDLVEALGVPEAFLDWLQFRCELLERSLKAFIQAAKSHGGSFLFGPDNYPASFALLVGHRYRELERAADFLMPLLNHPTIFKTLVFAEACKTLLEWNRGLDEEATLRLLYSLFGYGDLRLPGSISGLLGRHVAGDTYETEVPLHELIYREAVKAKAFTSGSKPIITVLEGHAGVKPNVVKQRIAAVRRAGVDGVAFTTFEGATDETLAAIREGLQK
ncbi:MAG: hypothetical protein QW587_01860 [Candidatus Bathyarchaeia archaeon]